MTRRQVSIIYNNDMLENPEIRALINTVIDAFCSFCGLYADDILFVKDQSEKVFDKNVFLLPNNGDRSNDRYIISLREISKVGNNDIDYFEDLLQMIFSELIKIFPHLENVINFFLDNRLWEITTLLDICNSDGSRKELANKCDTILSNIDTMEVEKNDIHYIYTIQYLKFLNLSLLKDCYSSDMEKWMNYNKKLYDLYYETIKYYEKTNSPVFLKLNGMILGKIGNIGTSEKTYICYRSLLFKDGSVPREIGRSLYDIGHIYENYSCRSTYTLRTIHCASKYYNMAYEYDHDNYMAWYKKALVSHVKEIDSINELMRLLNSLDQMIADGRDTFKMHLYRYIIINKLIVYSMNHLQNADDNNIKYLNELEEEYIRIESFLKYLNIYNEYDSWLNELKEYLNFNVKEIVDLLLILRRDGISDEFIKKRSQLQKVKKEGASN